MDNEKKSPDKSKSRVITTDQLLETSANLEAATQHFKDVGRSLTEASRVHRNLLRRASAKAIKEYTFIKEGIKNG